MKALLADGLFWTIVVLMAATHLICTYLEPIL